MSGSRLSVILVTNGGAADTAGVQVGDFLDNMGGVDLESGELLDRAIKQNTSGSELKLYRNGQPISFTIPPGRLGIEVNTISSERYFRDIDREKRALNMLVTTAHFVEGRPVKKLIDVVGAQCVFGGGPMKDLFAGVRNLVGGRAASIQDLLSDARREAMIDLKRNAASLDANAIIAINIQHSEIAEGGTMIMVTATGTAVELADA